MNWVNIFFFFATVFLLLFAGSRFFDVAVPDVNGIFDKVEDIIKPITIETNLSEEQLHFEYPYWDEYDLCKSKCLNKADYKKDKFYSLKDSYFKNDSLVCECRLN